MHLNIKSDEAHLLASRLATATGESMTRAVTEALREKLAKVERELTYDERLARVREIAASIRSRIPKPLPTQKEMDDWLYDEDGLPR